jgi:excisionase family DNA binding protein
MTDPKSHYQDLPDVLTVDEAAAYLRLARSSVYQAVRERVIPSVRIGRRVVIPKRALARLLEPETREGGEERNL